MGALRGVVLAILLGCAAVTGAFKAQADPLLLTTRPAAEGIIDWSQFGPVQTQFDTSHEFVSTTGVAGTLTLAPSQIGITQEQCCIGLSGIWDGNFTPGDIVVDTENVVGTTLTLSFNRPILTAGAQIQWNSLGDFTAQIQAFSGNHLLATFTEDGSDNGSAIFLGVTSSVPNITSIAYQMVCPEGSNPGCYGFAINQVSVRGVPVPEPSSLSILFAVVLLGLFAARPHRQ